MKLTNAFFREWFGDIFFPLGFSYYKRTFYRVYGDVLQVFTGSNINSYLRIGFNFFALCDDFYPYAFDPEVSFWIDIIRILARKYAAAIPSFEFDEEKLYDRTKEYVKDNLVPVLQRSVDAEHAYEELVQYNRMYLVSGDGMRGLPPEEAERRIEKYCSTSTSVCLSLKSGNLERAEQHMKYVQRELSYPWKEEYQERLHWKNQDLEYLNLYYGYQISHQQWIADLRRTIQDRDMAYLEERFAEHEKQWRDYLSTLPKNRRK